MITPLDDAQTVQGHLEEDLADPILFFHGKESGPFGTKYQALAEKFPQIQSPDFEGIDDLDERLAIAEKATRGMTNAILVGSSMGGLVAALLYDAHPERIFGYVLVAPAVHLEEAKRIAKTPMAGRARIVQGYNDEIVPDSRVQAFAEWHQIRTLFTGDDHRMHKSLYHILRTVGDLVKLRGA